jgi:hypothetical protein
MKNVSAELAGVADDESDFSDRMHNKGTNPHGGTFSKEASL